MRSRSGLDDFGFGWSADTGACAKNGPTRNACCGRKATSPVTAKCRRTLGVIRLGGGLDERFLCGDEDMKLEQLLRVRQCAGSFPMRWLGCQRPVFGSRGPRADVQDTRRWRNELLYRTDERRLEVVEHGRPWSFDVDGALFSLRRIASAWRTCSTRRDTARTAG